MVRNAGSGRIQSGRTMRRRGSIYAVVVGLLSVLMLLFFLLSTRMSRQVRLITLSDRTQTALIFLEAWAGDIVSQIRLGLSRGDARLIQSFTQPGTAGRPALAYQPGNTLRALAASLDIDLSQPPEMVFTDIRPLNLPECLSQPANPEGQEKGGVLAITCKTTFYSKSYSLTERVPFRVTARLTPVMRQFALFADQFHLEQPVPQGAADQVNVLPIERGNRTGAPGGAGVNGYPWNLMPTQKSIYDPVRNGFVFLGNADRPIVLNLAGELMYRKGDMTDLWEITPSCFPAIDPGGASFSALPMFLNAEGEVITIRALPVPLRKADTFARLGLMGFSRELADSAGGPYAGTILTLDYLLADDPGFAPFKAQRRFLGVASALKLVGRNLEPYLAPDASLAPPVRRIFGNVWQRFFVTSLWSWPSSAGLGDPLFYRSAPGFKPPPGRTWGGTRFQFEPVSGTYADFMSRTVSGDPAALAGSEENRLAIPASRDAQGRPKLAGPADFTGVDGIRMSGKFEELPGQWFKSLHEPAVSIDRSVRSRISRCFRNQEEFKAWAGVPENRLWIDGVVAVDGPLELADFYGSDIRGGVVLVQGPITLGAITRGFAPANPSRPLITDPAFFRFINGLTGDKMLTFVSLTGEPITLTSDVQLGVQLISFRPGLGAPETFISWKDGRRVLLAGGVAVSTLQLAQRAQEFRSMPDFFYAPGMAEPAMPLAVAILDEREEFDFHAE